MPRQSRIEQNVLGNLVNAFGPAVAVLNDIHDAFGSPFVSMIANTTLSLLTMLENVKRNKAECAQLMADIHGLLYAIINLHLTSETVGSLAPAVLEDIGKFAQTLQKIHAFFGAQQDGTKIKHFFKQTEMGRLLKECHSGVEQAQGIFQARFIAHVSAGSDYFLGV
ncbi:hypothetical protein GGX14DRAFT_397792 [Mycena pura]|uniref:Uncharacterized protein n=1 Tax=Mycena pura TaxID=153505 RepID=A0AAD6YA97_9AGAR|nr:hypothetical protein GGX14DRAFT_397792 [Mycena pura]